MLNLPVLKQTQFPEGVCDIDLTWRFPWNDVTGASPKCSPKPENLRFHEEFTYFSYLQLLGDLKGRGNK